MFEECAGASSSVINPFPPLVCMCVCMQELQSPTKLLSNMPRLVLRAANAGFSFSHVMVHRQPYHIGGLGSWVPPLLPS